MIPVFDWRFPRAGLPSFEGPRLETGLAAAGIEGRRTIAGRFRKRMQGVVNRSHLKGAFAVFREGSFLGVDVRWGKRAAGKH